MALVSLTAQNASLDNDYGATKGPNAPAAHVLALYAGDPLTGGTELDDTIGGYARVTITNDATGWPDAADGGAKTAAPVSFPTSTDDGYSDVATHWLLLDAADGTTAWDSGLLDDPISIDGAGVTPDPVTPTVYYSEPGE